MDCIFCKIGSKAVKAMVINESVNFLAFLDIHPHAPGHTLVIPRPHITRFIQLPANYGNELIEVIAQVMEKLKTGLNATDFTIGINEGLLAGQAVPHLHFHVIPRFAGDQGGSIHSVVYNKPKESVEEVYNKMLKCRKMNKVHCAAF